MNFKYKKAKLLRILRKFKAKDPLRTAYILRHTVFNNTKETIIYTGEKSIVEGVLTKVKVIDS